MPSGGERGLGFAVAVLTFEAPQVQIPVAGASPAGSGVGVQTAQKGFSPRSYSTPSFVQHGRSLSLHTFPSPLWQ